MTKFSANFCGCRVVGVADPLTVVNLNFLDRSRYFSFKLLLIYPHKGWVDPVPDPLLLRKSGSAWNRTRNLWVSSQELWPLDHRTTGAVRYEIYICRNIYSSGLVMIKYYFSWLMWWNMYFTVTVVLRHTRTVRTERYIFPAIFPTKKPFCHKYLFSKILLSNISHVEQFSDF
jgi:hypothetical protein